MNVVEKSLKIVFTFNGKYSGSPKYAFDIYSKVGELPLKSIESDELDVCLMDLFDFIDGDICQFVFDNERIK